MNSSSLIDNEQLASLKSVFAGALRDFNEHRTEDYFSVLRASVDAYMSFIEVDDVRNSL
jgi:hypothetical protein